MLLLCCAATRALGAVRVYCSYVRERAYVRATVGQGVPREVSDRTIWMIKLFVCTGDLRGDRALSASSSTVSFPTHQPCMIYDLYLLAKAAVPGSG